MHRAAGRRAGRRLGRAGRVRRRLGDRDRRLGRRHLATQGATDDGRERVALRVIAIAFALLALYITIQSAVILASSSHPGSSGAGIVWLAATVLVMLTLAGVQTSQRSWGGSAR